MTPNQKLLRDLETRKTELRREQLGLAAKALTDESRDRLQAIATETLDVETRSAVLSDAVHAEDKASIVAESDLPADAETRARLELRGRCNVGAYLQAAIGGRRIAGAEAELAQAVGAADNAIPMELWERPPEARSVEQRDITPAPGTVGVDLDTLQPAVFAPSIAAHLMIDMPVVPSGTYASGTISTAVSAAARNRGDAVPSTPGAFTVETATPRRVGANLELAVEDIAAVGAANFESVLRENISLVLSAELDDQIINGDGTAPNISGLFTELTDAAAPSSGIETFDRLLAIALGGIDGLWATELSHIALMLGVDTYKLAYKSYRDAGQNFLGHESFGQYSKNNLSMFMTNSRMPSKVSHIQQGILCRKGRMGLKTAVLPTWGHIAIDDIYSGATKGQRGFTVSALVGSKIIVVQSGAYRQIAARVSV